MIRRSCCSGWAVEYLASSRVIRPGVVTVLMRVAAAREKSRAETWQRVAHLVEPTRAAELDRLLVVDPLVGFTRLHWLGRGATQPSPAAVTVELAKLRYLRGLDAHELDLSMLPAERRRFLAALGHGSARSSSSAGTRSAVTRSC